VGKLSYFLCGQVEVEDL